MKNKWNHWAEAKRKTSIWFNKVDDDEAVNERKDIDGSESSENETNHQTR